jgi:hypothetical protein
MHFTQEIGSHLSFSKHRASYQNIGVRPEDSYTQNVLKYLNRSCELPIGHAARIFLPKGS